MSSNSKDYSSISPSAKSLLLLKGYTNIPYAKATAALLEGAEIFDLSFDDKDLWFWIRVMHFELRYWSIDQLLGEVNATNILELSSGYSLRGLDLCVKSSGIHYIDTDLPEVVDVKREMIATLGLGNAAKGHFDVLPLNALDEASFDGVIERFDPGPVTIVNEGLLMYLNLEEKKQLCRTIHRTLSERGGYWITADIYVQRSDEMRAELPLSESERNFHERHNIEGNKFASYDAARAFFEAQGFEVVKEAVPDYTQLSILPQLTKLLPEEVRNSKEPPPKVQATWMLRAVAQE
jgi:O-methyltransferase involved in polyketide biosynthesis